MQGHLGLSRQHVCDLVVAPRSLEVKLHDQYPEYRMMMPATRALFSDSAVWISPVS
jgi:hypothetical protein